MNDLLLGLGLGFGLGITPGPMLALVINTTLQRGLKAGLTVAFSALIPEVPVVLLSTFVLTTLPGWFEALVGLIGGAFMVWLGVDTLRKTWCRTESSMPFAEARTDHATPEPRTGVWWHGALVSVLNPQSWLFWMGAGGQLLVGAWRVGPGHAVGFLFGFYGMIFTIKMVVAVLTERGKRFLSSRGYNGLIVASGVVLIGFGVLLIWRSVGTLV